MWRLELTVALLVCSLLAAAKAVSIDSEQEQGFVDEEAEAIVIEAPAAKQEPRSRQGRQFSWGTGVFRGMYPASTMPLMPVAQTGNYLCLTATGQMMLCSMGGGLGGSNNFRQWGGQQWGGQPGGGWGGQPQQPQWPGQQPGGGGQWGGQPQWPQGPQQPGGYPPQQGGQPGGWPQGPPQGGGGGWPPQQGGGGYPPQGGGGGWPQGPGGGGQGPPPQGPPPGAGNKPVPVTDAPAPGVGPPGPGSSYPKNCGLGGYGKIKYNEQGMVAEEQERLELDHQHPFKVVNGWPADQGEWPWIAALLQNGRQFCGGSLISKKHILTAAHCVAHMSKQDVAALTVRLGDHYIRQTGETEIFESAAARVVRHREFTQQTLHKDVAIITLKDEVPDMDNVRAVCLPSGSDTYANRTGTVVGWGSIKEQGPQPDELREVTVRIWDNPTCKDTYGNAAPGGIMDHMLCAGQKGKDSCSGDSGGPMQIGEGATWKQIGIVSWGIGCGKSHYPGVYTRVTAVKSWIDKIVREY